MIFGGVKCTVAHPTQVLRGPTLQRPLHAYSCRLRRVVLVAAMRSGYSLLALANVA